MNSHQGVGAEYLRGARPSADKQRSAGMNVRVKGVHRRTATDDTKECASDQCGTPRIRAGQDYARVLRHDDRIEMFHVECFADEFGEALRA